MKATGEVAEVVQSLAKWKRYALGKYRFGVRFGLYTDMNAIRRDEELDNLHSAYVDQWDWEAGHLPRGPHVEFLQATVPQDLRPPLRATAERICAEFPALDNYLPDDICFVSTQQLEDLYPDLTPKQRETAYVRERGAAFIMQIGGKLRSGKSTTAARPTTTTGSSTATSCSTIPCSTAPSRSPRWASASTKRASSPSSKRKTASTVWSIPSTRRSSRANCR